ncbi:hypothetical protein [Burkholderia sp. Bp9142]|uniref:hypothetical protein n=1 Tax=Burkholderia sp. Bp9142 TaxID=2184573 RepID=UPI000F59DFB1|nr:hypothetical protein [Burkholderia sp. Bp9142]RQR42431.1 hypothetical protein DIE22_02635 [Burkholderia sp. Bp9142]
MKFWVRIIACFLIAWLPMLGYPAQVMSCPEMSSMPAVQRHVNMADSFAMTGCISAAKHHVTSTQSPACHGNMGGAACSMPAIPVSHAVVFAPATPVYRAIAHAFGEQFIPELPAPPPRSL